MPLLCLILAGGKSRRMGHDKALLYDSVNTLSRRLEEKGCRVIVACGSNERNVLFSAASWPDPVESTSLADVLRMFAFEHDEEIQLFPCDMYRLDEEAINAVLSQSPGVPVDIDGCEQYTLTRIPKSYDFPRVSSLNELFVNLNRNDMGVLGNRLENFNHPIQIDDLNKSNQ